MKPEFPFRLIDDPASLGEYAGWAPEVYVDFDAYRRGELTREGLDAKYRYRVAILCLDMTGFTQACIDQAQIDGLLRIYDAQRVCVPVLQDHKASLIHAFADDLVALFEEPGAALDAALELHRRVALFNNSPLASEQPAECCIGIGYGEVYRIGPNLAQGDEMNRASKLGEDIARGRETLVTENVFAALKHRQDIAFEPQSGDDLQFPFYRAVPAITAI